MTREQFQRLDDLQAQSVYICDAVRSVKDLLDSESKNVTAVLTWTIEKAQVLSDGLDDLRADCEDELEEDTPTIPANPSNPSSYSPEE